MINRTIHNIPKIMNLIFANSKACSAQQELINVPPAKYVEHRK